MTNQLIQFKQSNLIFILNALCDSFSQDPRTYVSMEEIVNLFKTKYKIDDDMYMINQNELVSFFDDVNDVLVTRLMVDMDKRGLATLAHDGNQLCLIKKKR